MHVMIIRLDYDDKNEDEVIEWINYASEVIRVKIKDIILRKSRNGGIHTYVYVSGSLNPVQQFLFRYYAGEDRKRINADVKRYNVGYPLGIDFLFYQYVHKPHNKLPHASEFEYFIHVLAIAAELSQNAKHG